MSTLFSSGSKKTNTAQQQQSEPWAPTMPYLTQFLSDIDAGRSVLGPSQDQLDAFAKLKTNAAAGNPNTADIQKLAQDQFAASSNSGQVGDAYKTLQDQLGDYASGKKLDFANDPYVQQMLKMVGDDTQSRINRMYAGAGRDLSGINQQAIARGVQQAQLPILSDLFQKGQQNQITTADILNRAGVGAATTGQQLDANALSTRAGAIPIGQAGMDAQNYGPNAVLNLDQQLKQMPLDDMSQYANLLLPVAGLGGQQAGTGTSKSSGSGFSLGLNMLSDERAKEDIEQVGETNDGQKIYRYRYKGSPEMHIGLIAQDVEKRTPDAVDEGPGGFKMVDYERATQKAARLSKSRKGGGY